MYPKTFLSFFLIIGFFQLTTAQVFSDRFSDLLRSRMEFGFQGGTAGYIGDINDKVYKFNSFSGGLNAKYYFNNISSRDRTWGVRLDLNYHNLKGDDASSGDSSKIARNLKFSNNVYEVSSAVEFQFWDFRPDRTRKLFTPYVFLGAGMIFHNPKAPNPDPNAGGQLSLIDQVVEARKISYQRDAAGDIETDTLGNVLFTNLRPYSKMALIIPFGAGIKYNLSGSLAPWSIGLELNYRYVFSDFLDGVGKNSYLDYSVVNPLKKDTDIADWTKKKTDWENLAYPPSISGQPYPTEGTLRGTKGNDFFMTAVFRVTYTLYKWRDPQWK